MAGLWGTSWYHLWSEWPVGDVSAHPRTTGLGRRSWRSPRRQASGDALGVHPAGGCPWQRLPLATCDLEPSPFGWASQAHRPGVRPPGLHLADCRPLGLPLGTTFGLSGRSTSLGRRSWRSPRRQASGDALGVHPAGGCPWQRLPLATCDLEPSPFGWASQAHRPGVRPPGLHLVDCRPLGLPLGATSGLCGRWGT